MDARTTKRRTRPPPMPAAMRRRAGLGLVALAGLRAEAFTNIHAPARGPAPAAPAAAAAPGSPTALGVWWFGGTPGATSETSTSGEECELVAVRIDRTSANSRRIAGEIIVDAPPADVWAIITDYDHLATHVPNLVRSERVRAGPGEAGDGTYTCRLYQRGAQKIVGFEFGKSEASVGALAVIITLSVGTAAAVPTTQSGPPSTGHGRL